MKKSAMLMMLVMCLLSGYSFADSPKVGNETKTIVVTCASGELGSATARVLARDYNLILTGRDLTKLKALQSELIANHSHKYEISTLDYMSPSSIENFKSYLNNLPGSLSGLVLITPRPQFYGKALLQEEDKWLEVFRATFTGPLEVLKMTLPRLMPNGNIVVIAGTTSVQLLPDAGPSGVIRRMWTTYTKALSYELGPQGIRLNAVSPGVVLTSFHEQRIQKKANENGVSYEKQMEQDVANIPLRRHAKPQEVAQTIKFLISDESSFITGINLVHDGGKVLSLP